MIKVTIDGDRYHTVHITGDFTGPHVDLDLTPAQAYSLLQELEKNARQLFDLKTNYYECAECGGMHHNSEKTTAHSDVESDDEQ